MIKKTNFNALLAKDGSVSTHHDNLQNFAVEKFDKLFQFRETIPYELKRRSQFQIPFVHLVFSGTESLKFLGPKV